MGWRDGQGRSDDWPYEGADLTDVPALGLTCECLDGTCECRPIQEGEMREFAVLVCDEHGRPMPGARCRVLYRGRVVNEDQPYADEEGWLRVTVPYPVNIVTLEWAPPETPLTPRYPYRKRYHVDLREDFGRVPPARRLHNLGFSRWSEQEENVKEFQRAFGYADITGDVEDIRQDLLAFHDEGGIPPLDDEEISVGDIPFVALVADRKPKKRKKDPVRRKAPTKKHKPAVEPPGKGTGTARPRARGTLNVRVCSLFAQPAYDVARSCRWDSRDSHPVVGAVVELFDAQMAVVPAFVAANGAPMTNARGEVTLKIGGLADGEYVLKLNPPAGHELRGALLGPVMDPAVRDAQLRPVGPDDAFFNDPPMHTRFRFLEFRITIRRGVVDKEKTRLAQGMRHLDAIAAHGVAVSESESTLLVDWKPDWVQCGFVHGLKIDQRDPGRRERMLSRVQFIVLHHTDASTPGSTINHFSDIVNNKDKTGAHYLVDVDGHVIKMAHETIKTFHAGQCFWYGLDSHETSTMSRAGFDWNDISVAVEQVNEDSSFYSIDQVAGTKNLIERVRKLYGTSHHNVLGHGEIALHRRGEKRLGNKASCPGEGYEWTFLESSGNATSPAPGANVPHARYGNFFTDPNAIIDDKSPRLAIAGLQLTLSELGYFVNGTARYDEATSRAVEAFQVRYCSGRFRRGERDRIMNGRKRIVDVFTIQRMHEVLAARAGFRY